MSRSQNREERATNSPTPPRRGELLPDFTLKKGNGDLLMLSDFRGRNNLVLVFLSSPSAPIEGSQAQLLHALSEKSGEVRESETRVIVVVRPEQLSTVEAISGELIATADESGSVLAHVGAEAGTKIYFTDKFREVFHVDRIPAGETLPAASQILEWVRFVGFELPGMPSAGVACRCGGLTPPYLEFATYSLLASLRGGPMSQEQDKTDEELKQHIDDELDEALDETFPASDPIEPPMPSERKTSPVTQASRPSATGNHR